jgi:hypothetical protein
MPISPGPVKSSPKKVAAKLLALKARVPATFFRPRLGHTQSIAFRDPALSRGRFPISISMASQPTSVGVSCPDRTAQSGR